MNKLKLLVSYLFSLSANDENVDRVSFLILIPSLPDI